MNQRVNSFRSLRSLCPARASLRSATGSPDVASDAGSPAARVGASRLFFSASVFALLNACCLDTGGVFASGRQDAGVSSEGGNTGTGVSGSAGSGGADAAGGTGGAGGAGGLPEQTVSASVSNSASVSAAVSVSSNNATVSASGSGGNGVGGASGAGGGLMATSAVGAGGSADGGLDAADGVGGALGTGGASGTGGGMDAGIPEGGPSLGTFIVGDYIGTKEMSGRIQAGAVIEHTPYANGGVQAGTAFSVAAGDRLVVVVSPVNGSNNYYAEFMVPKPPQFGYNLQATICLPAPINSDQDLLDADTLCKTQMLPDAISCFVPGNQPPDLSIQDCVRNADNSSCFNGVAYCIDIQ